MMLAQHPTDKVETQLNSLSSTIQEVAVDDLGGQLQRFSSALERIPSPPTLPHTTLQILGEARAESAWQDYLAYFLDPTAPHGLGTDALNRFLQGLHQCMRGNIPDHATTDVIVETEKTSDSGSRVDLIIRDENRFFICCELKLYSTEGQNQTNRYVEDDQIGTVTKDSFPEQGHHYVYIRPEENERAGADEFVNLSWREVQDWLRPLLRQGRGRYPTRTTAQLSDFLDTIQHAMTEDEHLQIERKKMQLYFTHQEAIREARNGLEAIHEYESENWRRRFVEDYLPDTWSEDWHCNSNIYGQFYHSDWRQDDGLALSGDRIQMHFVHLIRHLEAFEEGTLTVQLRWPGESRYRTRFKELFVSDRFADQLDQALGEHDINKRADYSYKNPRFTEKVYSVNKADLPGSYYEMLSQAVKEHQQVAPAINTILSAAIRDVEQDL
jgi:regulator of replication initiation timing